MGLRQGSGVWRRRTGSAQGSRRGSCQPGFEFGFMFVTCFAVNTASTCLQLPSLFPPKGYPSSRTLHKPTGQPSPFMRRQHLVSRTGAMSRIQRRPARYLPPSSLKRLLVLHEVCRDCPRLAGSPRLARFRGESAERPRPRRLKDTQRRKHCGETRRPCSRCFANRSGFSVQQAVERGPPAECWRGPQPGSRQEKGNEGGEARLTSW